MSNMDDRIELKALLDSNPKGLNHSSIPDDDYSEDEEEPDDDFVYASSALSTSSKPRTTSRSTLPALSTSIQSFWERNNGFLLIGLSQMFFASINCLVKVLQNRIEIPVWQIIVVRMSVTGLGCVLYMLWAGIEHPILGPPGVRFLLCIRGIVGFGGLFGVYFSLRYLSLSDATVLTFLAPVLCGVLASVLLKEPYSRTEMLTGVGSLFGVLLIAKPDFLSFIFGVRPPAIGPGGAVVTSQQKTAAIALALMGVFGAAGAYLMIRFIGGRANALHSITFFSGYCVLICSIYPLLFHSPPVFIFDWQFVLLIVPIGFLGFFAQVFLTLGLQREKAGRGTLAVYSNLLFAIILEKLVFRKNPDNWSLVGSGIIIGGAIWVALEKQKIPKKSEERLEEEGEVFDIDEEEDK